MLPEVARPDLLTSVIGLSGVRLFRAAKNGTAYVGYLFRCAWDEEHGLGISTHENRVVEIGSADVALVEWHAEADAVA